MGLNATARTFGISKNTVLDWEQRCADLQPVLFVYALVHQFLQVVIEGDEAYTKVEKNVPPDQSEGWTLVLMDRASRFIWTLACGKKDRTLFSQAVETLEQLIQDSEDLTLLTDGERRYGNLLFETCWALSFSARYWRCGGRQRVDPRRTAWYCQRTHRVPLWTCNQTQRTMGGQVTR
jgi:hypothetical protein